MVIEPLEDTPSTVQPTMPPAQHTLRIRHSLQQHPYQPAAAAQHWRPCQRPILPGPQPRMLTGTTSSSPSTSSTTSPSTSSRSSSSSSSRVRPAFHHPTQAHQRALALLAAPGPPGSATTPNLLWTLSWTSSCLLIQAQTKPRVVTAEASAALSCHQQCLPGDQASAAMQQRPQVPTTLTTESPSCA